MDADHMLQTLIQEFGDNDIFEYMDDYDIEKIYHQAFVTEITEYDVSQGTPMKNRLKTKLKKTFNKDEKPEGLKTCVGTLIPGRGKPGDLFYKRSRYVTKCK